MNTYNIGDLTDFIGDDTVIFDMTDEGGILIIRYGNPTKDEISAFNAKLSFKITAVDGIIFLLVRMGNTQWMDAPYYRWRSYQLTHIDPIEDGQGLAIHAMFINGVNGKLVAQKIVSLDTGLTRQLLDGIQAQPKLPDYDERLARIQRIYSTANLLARANKK